MLPKFNSFDDVIDFLLLCHLGILVNILDVRTYQYPGCGPDDPLTRKQMDHMQRNDTNALTYRTRMEFIYTRGVAYCLLDWFAESFQFYDAESRKVNAWEKIISPLLAHQLLVIKKYKEMAPISDSSTIGCTLESLSHQIGILLSPDNDVYRVMESLGIQRNTLAWPFSEKYTFQETTNSNSKVQGKPSSRVRINRKMTPIKAFDMVELGATPGDKIFLDMVQEVKSVDGLQFSTKNSHPGFKNKSTSQIHRKEMEIEVSSNVDTEVETEWGQSSTKSPNYALVKQRGVKRRWEGGSEAEEVNELEENDQQIHRRKLRPRSGKALRT